MVIKNETSRYPQLYEYLKVSQRVTNFCISGYASSLVFAFRVSSAPMLSQAGQRPVIAFLLFDAVLPQLRVGGIAFLRNQGSLDEQGLSLVAVGVLNHLGR